MGRIKMMHASSSSPPLDPPEKDIWFNEKNNTYKRANFSYENDININNKNSNKKENVNLEQDLFDVSLTDDGNHSPSRSRMNGITDEADGNRIYNNVKISGTSMEELKVKQRLSFFQRTTRRIVSSSYDSFRRLSHFFDGTRNHSKSSTHKRDGIFLADWLVIGRHRRIFAILFSIIGIYILVMIDSQQNTFQEEQNLQKKQHERDVSRKSQSGFWGRNMFSANHEADDRDKAEWSFPQLNEPPYSLLKDVDEPLDYKSDVPYFWHIHKSGGSTMKHIFSCLQLVQTRRMGKPDCSSDNGNPLQICNLPFISEQFGGTDVINVDCSSPSGIDRAIELELMSFHEDPFIVDTSRVYDALSVFTEARKGRLFILFRHPVERIISKYYYTKTATWETGWPYQSIVANMTLTEYTESKYCHSNWVTRRLVNKMNVMELTEEDFELAKEILRRKAFILLLDELEDSIQQMQQYFHWHINKGPYEYEQKYCLDEFVNRHPVNENKNKGAPTEKEWDLIRNRNLYDIHLMAYAKLLFKEQKRNLIQQNTQ